MVSNMILRPEEQKCIHVLSRSNLNHDFEVTVCQKNYVENATKNNFCKFHI